MSDLDIAPASVSDTVAEPETKVVDGKIKVKTQGKVLVAVPCQETINAQFVSCLYGLQKPPGSKIMFTQSSILPQSRDTLANLAITGGYTHILFIDSDMTFPADGLHKLFQHDVDIVTGLCFARKGNHNPCIYKAINYENPSKTGNNENITVETDIERPFFEIKACGMAFCLIKTSVLLDIRNKNDGDLFRYIDTFGEDLSFCIRALKAGYKIYCDTTIPIGHVGEYVYTKKDWLMYLATSQAIAKAVEDNHELFDKSDKPAENVTQNEQEVIAQELAERLESNKVKE